MVVVLRIGLTGGIGAGKSAALARLRELGAVVIDYDRLAREVVQRGSTGFDAVVDTFGPAVLAPDGNLDRAALGRIVFRDPVELERLNAIVHPEVHRLAAEREAAADAADPRAVVVHDIPLLAESADAAEFHIVVVVHAPVDIRLARIEARGLAPADARARIAAQADDAARAAIADVTLDGSGTVANLNVQVDALWDRLEREVQEEADAP